MKKKRFQAGLSYEKKDGTIIPAKTMGPSCGENCRFKCEMNISLQDRSDQFAEYYRCENASAKWQFIINHSEALTPATTSQVAKKNRIATRKYFLVSRKGGKSHEENYHEEKNHESMEDHNEKEEQAQDGKKVRVCQKMFANTLGISQQVITTAFKKFNPISLLAEEDKRGKFTRKLSENKKNMKNSVYNHIESYAKRAEIGHYGRKNSKRMYLEQNLSVSKMYNKYEEEYNESLNGHDLAIEENQKATERQYRDMFNEEFNMSFNKPKKDLCDDCQAFENCTPQEKSLRKESQDKHIALKEVARNAKDADKLTAINSSTTVAAVFDFEKVLVSPKCEAGTFYYMRKLSVMNFTVYNLATREATCYVWDETIGKKGGHEVASCLLKYVTSEIQKGKDTFLFWSDNCGPQNKNSMVFSLYQWMAKNFHINITHRFLIKGHTQNEGDNVHSKIETHTRHMDIFAPSMWYEQIFLASKKRKYSVIEMTINDFLSFDSISKPLSKARNVNNENVGWAQIIELTVTSQNPMQIQYRHEYGGNQFLINLAPSEETEQPPKRGRKRKIHEFPNPTDFEMSHKSLIPLKKDKYKDLQILCDKMLIPSKYHDFYKNLPCEK